MRRNVKLFFVFMALCFGIAASVSAQGAQTAVAACLPPISNSEDNDEDCILTYHPPPPLGPSIEIDDCRFLPGRTKAPDQVFLTLQCAVSNRSDEEVLHFKYGIRCLQAESATVLLEVGFEGALRFGTAHLVPVLQPQETRLLRLVAPDVPTGTSASELDVSVEVLRVGLPDGRMLR